MNDKICIIAPHPDDETLGCGGRILKYLDAGVSVTWVLVTKGFAKDGFAPESVAAIAAEVDQVKAHYPGIELVRLNHPAILLDTLPLRDLVTSLGEVFDDQRPTVVYLPFGHDVHSDHQVVFQAAWSALKTFRRPFVREIYAYETPSETEYSLPGESGFMPNHFCNISDYFSAKLEILNLYQSQLGTFPFPRSKEMVQALAQLRGSQAGVAYAEAFMNLRTFS